MAYSVKVIRKNTNYVDVYFRLEIEEPDVIYRFKNDRMSFRIMDEDKKELHFHGVLSESLGKNLPPGVMAQAIKLIHKYTEWQIRL